MRKQIILLFCSITLSLCANAQGIHFMQELSWTEVKAKAKAENKFIFVDLYATWCGPCKEMERYVYPDEKVGAYFNNNFISFKLQMDRTAADDAVIKNHYRDAKEVDELYQPTAYPTFIFLSPEGELAYKTAAYLDAEGLIALARRATDPKQRYDLLLNSYAKGSRDTAFLKRIIALADSVGHKIMAHKIAYENEGPMPPEADNAYSFLKRELAHKTPVKVNYTGSWEISYPLCELGKLPLRVAAKKLTIRQSLLAIHISRLAKDENNTENTITDTALLDGKPHEDISLKGRIKKVSTIGADEGRGLTVFREFTFPGSKTEVDFITYEKWALSEDGKTLTVKSTTEMNNNAYTFKAVYLKK